MADHPSMLKSKRGGKPMDAWPHLVCGVLGGWIVKGWTGGRDPAFAPTCSCHCELPTIEEQPGFSFWTILWIALLFGLLGLILGFGIAKFSFAATNVPVIETGFSFQKGKKGSGVTGKTLEIKGK